MTPFLLLAACSTTGPVGQPAANFFEPDCGGRWEVAEPLVSDGGAFDIRLQPPLEPTLLAEPLEIQAATIEVVEAHTWVGDLGDPDCTDALTERVHFVATLHSEDLEVVGPRNPYFQMTTRTAAASLEASLRLDFGARPSQGSAVQEAWQKVLSDFGGDGDWYIHVSMVSGLPTGGYDLSAVGHNEVRSLDRGDEGMVGLTER